MVSHQQGGPQEEAGCVAAPTDNISMETKNAIPTDFFLNISSITSVYLLPIYTVSRLPIYLLRKNILYLSRRFSTNARIDQNQEKGAKRPRQIACFLSPLIDRSAFKVSMNELRRILYCLSVIFPTEDALEFPLGTHVSLFGLCMYSTVPN